MSATLLFAWLTIREAQRRKILWVSLLLGVGFVGLFAIGFHFIYRELALVAMQLDEMHQVSGLLLIAGLYAVDTLVLIMTVLVSVTAVSGEIDSHTVEALVTKPVHRWHFILGKWLGFAVLVVLSVLLLGGALMAVVYVRAGFLLENMAAGLALMVLQGWIVLSLTILGGTRLSTLANGALAFMLFGIAFLGGWIEQIGALFANETAVDIGIVTSLMMPTDILWKRAVTLFQPRFANTPLIAGPFAVSSQPSELMVWYALGFTAVLLGLALVSFSRRDL